MLRHFGQKGSNRAYCGADVTDSDGSPAVEVVLRNYILCATCLGTYYGNVVPADLMPVIAILRRDVPKPDHQPTITSSSDEGYPRFRGNRCPMGLHPTAAVECPVFTFQKGSPLLAVPVVIRKAFASWWDRMTTDDETAAAVELIWPSKILDSCPDDYRCVACEKARFHFGKCCKTHCNGCMQICDIEISDFLVACDDVRVQKRDDIR